MNKQAIIIIIVLCIVGFFFGGSALFNQLGNNQVQQNSTGSTNSETATSTEDKASPVVVSENGLSMQDVKVGTGPEAKPGMVVTVNYIGTLQNGQKFDSSFDHGEPFSFVLGGGQVIAGWDQGLVGMKVGGTRKLIIPADLAYGSRAVGPIPPNSVLLFTVDLLSVANTSN